MAIRVPSRTRQRAYGYVAMGQLSCPVLISPADAAVLQAEGVDPIDVELEWGAVDGAASYHVYLSTNGSALTLVATTSETTHTLSDLALNGSYSWRIIAANPLRESSGCGTRSFSTLPAATIVEIFDEPGEYPWDGPNPFAVSVEARVLGAGGGGGGGVGGTGTANIVTGGGGGGGGAGIVKTFTPEELVGPIVITVGAGGAGGAGYGASQFGDAGSPGSASKFGDLLTAGGGGGGAGGQWRGAPWHVGGGGGGGVEEGPYVSSVDGGTGAAIAGGTAGEVGGAGGGTDDESGQIAVDAPSPTTDYGGGGGGGGDFEGSRGSVSLWGAPGGGGGSAAFNGLPTSERPGANGTPSTGATDTPAGGAAHSNGAHGVDPADPKMLAGSSGGGGGGGNGDSGVPPKNNGGNGGVGARGAGGGGGGGIYVDREIINHPFVYHAGSGGAGGNGYVVIITTNTVP